MNLSNFSAGNSSALVAPPPVCDHSAAWWTHQHNAYVFAYKIVTPVYFLFGIAGHVLCLLAFRKQAKKEAPYAYQIFVTVSETMEIFAFTCFSLSFRWFSGIENEGALWYQRNYFLMSYAAHVSFPALNAFITTCLLLSVSMAADRVIAMAKPFQYKNLNAKKHQTVALCLSVLIGFSTSIFDAFRFNVVEINSSDGFVRYAAVGDPVYMTTLLATFLAHLRDAIRGFALLALVTCNGLIAFLYRRRLQQVATMTSFEDKQRQAERQAAENTLLLLTVTQSILRSIGMTFLISFYAMIYVDPGFLSCGSLFMAPCLDATLQLASMVDFYFVLCVSKQFRGMILAVFGKKKITAVGQTTGTGTAQRAPTSIMVAETNARNRQ